MDPFISTLAELCKAHPTRSKWVFVPSHGLGHTLGERLVVEGTDWANLRFVTPWDVALEMAAPFLVERGVEPCPDGVGPALVMRLLLEMPRATAAYFRHLAEQPRMAEALWSAIAELRMAGLTAADLGREAFSSPDKYAELQGLVTAYEEHLTSRHLADGAAVYREALQHPEACAVQPDDCWLEMPGVTWSPLERELLDALPGTWLESAGLEVPGLEVPRRLATLGGRRVLASPSPKSDAERLAFLMKPAEAPPPFGDGTVEMFRAGGKEAEVEEVFRRILARGIPFDQVEIACASAEYVVLLWEKAQRHEWPITLGPGLPVTLSRPGRALLAFCAWVEGGFSAGGLRRLLQSGDMRLDLDGGPSAGQAARLLAQSEATWGRETYTTALTALAESYRERAADPEADEEDRARYTDRVARAERFGEWVGGLLALVPETPAGASVPLGVLFEGCAAFVDRVATKSSELDGAAAIALKDALEELRALRDLERPLADALGLARDRVERLTVGRDRARPGHLHVTSLVQAGHAGRLHTFVVGLEEGGVFPPGVEDPVLLDEEREALTPLLPTSRDRVSEALYAIVSRLAALGGHVCLSFSCRDLRETRETFPSWLLLQVLRLQEPGRELTYADLDGALGEPASIVPRAAGAAISDSGWWLTNLRGAGERGLAAVHGAFPWLVRGKAAEAARESDAFTAHDGFVPEAGPRLDPRASGRAVSATGLENLATCPFRYFLERGLGLEPVEEVEPDPDQWLDGRTRGSALHELYATILRELRERRESAEPARHGPRLRALGAAKLEELRTLIPPPSERVFDREREEFFHDLDLFLRFEAERSGREVVGLEVSFGVGGTGDESLAQPEPIFIDLGSGLRFRLRGRIDRIDRVGPGTFEVIDYKTGSLWLPGGTGATFAGGRQLQHALYALAAAQLLGAGGSGARVSASSYYFPTARGRGEPVVRPQGESGGAAALLRDLFDLLAAGVFTHTPEKDDCRYCHFQRACGRDPVARAKRKIAQAANAALAPYRGLAGHA